MTGPSRVVPLYDDPYEEPPMPHASYAESTDDTTNSDIFRQRLMLDDSSSVFDNRGPGDGASTRRDLPPFAAVSMPYIDDTLGSTNGGTSRPAVMTNPSLGNYDEPWDLFSKQRELEDKLRAMPNITWSPPPAAVNPSPAAPPRSVSLSQSSDDTRVLADGYDRPWDLQPHRRDDRDDVGYDKPWDLKPHEKDVRSKVAVPGEYDAPWDIKPRSLVERELIAAKSAKDAVIVRAGGAAVTPARCPTQVAPSSHIVEADRPVPPARDEPRDPKQPKVITAKTGNLFSK